MKWSNGLTLLLFSIYILFLGCHYKVFGRNGYIKSPKLNPRLSSCSWLVSVDNLYLITLSFSFLKLGDDDFIEVYDGLDMDTSKLAVYSRFNISENIGTLLSSSNNVFILLKYGTSSSYQAEFALEYGSHLKPTGMLH